MQSFRGLTMPFDAPCGASIEPRCVQGFERAAVTAVVCRGSSLRGRCSRAPSLAAHVASRSRHHSIYRWLRARGVHAERVCIWQVREVMAWEGAALAMIGFHNV